MTVGDPLEEVVVHLGQLLRRLPNGVPDWAAAELTFGQLRLLSRLFKEGPTSMSGIGDWLGIGLPSVTGMIERLERHGLVERRHRTDDRRIVDAHLTDRGRELVADILGIRMDTLRRLLRSLEPTELEELDRLFRLITERAGDAMP
jgi:DNA-binding MarR family transcriptional regulator